MTPALSVVVIGRNEGLRLKRCLASVRSMQDPGGQVELLYVDSASIDKSIEIARAFDARIVEVKPVRPTAALGRNAGWRVATAPLVLFLDGDTILDPAFVASCLPDLADPAIVAVCGNRREINPRTSWYNRILDLDWLYPAGFTDYCGGDVLFRRSALLEVDGYDENLIAGEEPEMCRRLRGKGYKILHVDRPMTGHDLAMTRFAQYWKRATRTGYAYAEVSARFRGSGLPFWEDEVTRNKDRVRQLLGIVALGILGSASLWSTYPVTAAAGLLVLLSLRSAWKARWKTKDIPTLLVYGFHSHVQQIPIYLGQLQYLDDKRKGRVRGLIEYKKAEQ